MIDIYLKFTDEAAATAVLYTLHPEVTNEQGTVVAESYTTANYANIDTIGVIYKRTGGTDEEPVMTPIPGWHVNVRGPMLLELQAFAIDPEPVTPVRVWA